jgi:hypothetical protein
VQRHLTTASHPLIDTLQVNRWASASHGVKMEEAAGRARGAGPSREEPTRIRTRLLRGEEDTWADQKPAVTLRGSSMTCAFVSPSQHPPSPHPPASRPAPRTHERVRKKVWSGGGGSYGTWEGVVFLAVAHTTNALCLISRFHCARLFDLVCVCVCVWCVFTGVRCLGGRWGCWVCASTPDSRYAQHHAWHVHAKRGMIVLPFIDMCFARGRKAVFKKTSSRLLTPPFHPSHRSTSTAAATTADGHHHTNRRDDSLLPIERAMHARMCCVCSFVHSCALVCACLTCAQLSATCTCALEA